MGDPDLVGLARPVAMLIAGRGRGTASRGQGCDDQDAGLKEVPTRCEQEKEKVKCV